MRLLVLDDDAAIGRLVARVATPIGFSCEIATDATAFRSSYGIEPPEVIVLDLQLGNTDGVEQLRFLADREYRHSLILVSGFDSRVLATVRDLAASLGLDATAALNKPLDLPLLRHMLVQLRQRSAPLTADCLLRAIRDDELVLEYQPIVDCRTRALRKVEALTRWQHPVLGLLPPSRFLPVAEANPEVMNTLTDWVVSRTVQAHACLRAWGIEVPLAVNVSPLDVTLDLPDRLDQMRRDGGMPPGQLCVEITETAAFRDPELTKEVLTRIRLKGMQLAIDDFGTGYSSLKLLRQVPFTTIKIDRSFVADLTTSRDSRAIVASIIDLANNMELESIAEGVETEACADLLGMLGVDLLQGYLMARPMPIGHLVEWALHAPSAEPEAKYRVMAAETRLPDEQSPPVPRASQAAADDEVVPADGAGRMALLTPRQQDVMRLLAEGISVKEIARQLGLAVGTVKTHMALAYSVLGAHNRIDALRRAGLTIGVM